MIIGEEETNVHRTHEGQRGVEESSQSSMDLLGDRCSGSARYVQYVVINERRE